MHAIPALILNALDTIHPSWRSIVRQGLEAVAEQDSDYLEQLSQANFLPTRGRLFAAFAIPLDQVRYVLIGEGPYPREESATGVCFMDGAVQQLWSEAGLSKQVNRATSLRNFIKMLLVAEGQLERGKTTAEAIAALRSGSASPPRHIETLAELQANLTQEGFLLLNASLVFRPEVAPLRDARAWRPFIETILSALAEHAAQAGRPAPRLVLWGKIAEQLSSLRCMGLFPRATSEHPYNLSFIGNLDMQALFRPMRLLVPRD